MTPYLALEMATDPGGVAVGAAGRVLAAVGFHDRRHAAATAPAIREVCRRAGLTVRDLRGIVLADGPGSFTGLRIAFATAKGLLSVRGDLAVATVPSLMGAAWLAHQLRGSPVAALYDALRGEVFGAVYAFAPDGMRTILEPTVGRPEELAGRCPAAPVAAVGDGAVGYPEFVRDWTGRDPLALPPGAARAGALIELVAHGAAAELADPENCEPAYGRPAEAQAKWERRHGRPLPGAAGASG